MPINILIVDDSADDRFVTRKMLEKGNYMVSEASEGIEALLKIGAGNIDVVLLDLAMPGMDGLELLEIIRSSLSQRVPIVIYTASTAYIAKDLMAKGSNAFLNKYGKPGSLVGKLEEVLQSKAA